jgi:hypothetical protein
MAVDVAVTEVAAGAAVAAVEIAAEVVMVAAVHATKNNT